MLSTSGQAVDHADAEQSGVRGQQQPSGQGQQQPSGQGQQQPAGQGQQQPSGQGQSHTNPVILQMPRTA